MEMESDYKESAVVTDSSDPLATRKFYDERCEKYENDMAFTSYNAHKIVVKGFLQLNLDNNVEILDLLAGTGLVGQLLREHGYLNVDAIDGSEEMLHVSKRKNLYRKYITALIGKGNPCPIDSESYDVVIGAGCFAPGHLYSDIFPELLRVVKPGGVIIWAVRKGYEESSPQYGRFYDDVDKFVAEGHWSYLVPRTEVPEYWQGSKGYIYIMQKKLND